MPRKRRAKFIFFTLDGVLVDSASSLLRVYQYFLAQFELNGSRNEFAEINGMTYKQLVQHLKKKHRIEQDVAELTEKYIELVSALYVDDHVKPRVEVEKLLDTLANTGYRFGLVTSAERRVVGDYVERHFPGRFEIMVFGEDVIRGKPDPYPYLAALDAADAPAHRLIAVEDTVAGIASATAAGLAAIGVAIDVPFTILRLTGAKAVVTSLDELIFMILG